MLRDTLGRDRGRAYSRVVHAAPGTDPLTIEVRACGKRTALAEGCATRRSATVADLPPGHHEVEIRPAGVCAPTRTRTFDLAPGHVYTST